MSIKVVASGNCSFTWTSGITNPTINISYKPGDYLIVCQMTNGGWPVPTGFTAVYSPNASVLQLSYYKFTTSGTNYAIPCAYSGAIN